MSHVRDNCDSLPGHMGDALSTNTTPCSAPARLQPCRVAAVGKGMAFGCLQPHRGKIRDGNPAAGDRDDPIPETRAYDDRCGRTAGVYPSRSSGRSPQGNAHTDTHADAQCNGNADANRDGHSPTDAHSYADCNASSDIDSVNANVYTDLSPFRHRRTHPRWLQRISSGQYLESPRRRPAG